MSDMVVDPRQWTCFEPDRPSGWDESDFRAFVAEHRWIFARTMPRNPHEYTLRRETRDATFDAAVRYIREQGRVEMYGGKPYRTLYLDDHKYWTMGAPREATILINRKASPAVGTIPERVRASSSRRLQPDEREPMELRGVFRTGAAETTATADPPGVGAVGGLDHAAEGAWKGIGFPIPPEW